MPDPRLISGEACLAPTKLGRSAVSIPEPVRLFFALWPEASLQQAFFEAGLKLYQRCGGRRTRRENIHLTLVFLGEVEADRLQRVTDVADQITLPAFDLHFTRLGWWRQNQVAWVATDETPRPLIDLVKQLQLGLVAEGFKFDERRFQAHITLLRKANCPPGLIESQPIVWQANAFVLVRSTLHVDGPHYAIVKRWPLQLIDG
ncbi:MAG: RNA 2',3'-cyclic phosphodiesterase [Burkholderiales bacterium]|nr:RNA 2',3'-cyclic phosphodiesterase [Burkholderiales bacterium]